MTFLMSCIITPILLKNLHGTTKVYLTMQQISSNFYLMTTSFTRIVARSIASTDLKSFIRNKSRFEMNIKFIHMFGEIFFYQQYVYLILQSLNYYQMICNPLQFDDYSKRFQIVKRVVIGWIISILLITPTIAHHINYFLTFPFMSISHIEILSKMNYCIVIYGVGALMTIKIVYTSVLVYVWIHVRSALTESRQLRKEKGTSSVLIIVCFIPQIINLVYLVSEIPRLTILVKDLLFREEDVNCVYSWSYLELRTILSSSVYSMVAAIHCIAYLSLFRSLRQGLCGGLLMCNVEK